MAHSTRTPRGQAPNVVPLRHPWRWLTAALLILLVALIAHALFVNQNIDHSVIQRYLFSSAILQGLKMTLILAVLSQVAGIVIGIIIAVMGLSDNPVLKAFSSAYVWILRAVPLLVQILIWGNFGILFKSISVNVPFTDLRLFSEPTHSLITVFIAAFIALSTSEGAYMAEIVRSGILSIDRGQREAGIALGMTSERVMRRIILPQALRVIVPPTGNDFISMLKNTSLVSVIAGGDMLTQAQNISAQNFRIIELLLVATFWYLIATSLATIVQKRLERRLSRSEVAPRARKAARVRATEGASRVA